MKMTPQQQNAVSHRGTTLLVSAGAGSGKTSTLSKRIISRISDPYDSAEIDDFLIVTFTNASAADLTEKIEREVSECVARDISNQKAMRQLAKIKYANISTISSFCVGVVKKHFQNLGLPAKVRICDSAEASLLKKRAVLDVIEEKYAVSESGAAFFDAVETFSGSKSDDKFIALIERLHSKIMSFPEPEEWCNQSVDFYSDIIDGKDYLFSEYGACGMRATADSLGEYINGLKSAISRAEAETELEQYISVFSTDLENAESVLSALENIENYSAAAELLFSVAKSRVPPVKSDSTLKDTVKALRDKAYSKFDKNRKLFFGAKEEKIKAAAYDCRRLLEEIFDIVRKVEQNYGDEKRSRGIIDFSDAERFTYKLFTRKKDGKVLPSEIAEQYRDLFAEIYIDEYQDINPIQDMIFRAICRYNEQGHETNRFMVGDIKQSIYRFRGARPDLFAAYLQSFSAVGTDAVCGSEKKEFLSDNFRCSEPVVNFTNLVFSEIMRERYGENDRLVFSKKEEFKITSPCEILLFENNAEEEADYYDDEIKATAQKILSLISDKSITGSNGKPYSYGDVAVLLPKVKKIADKYAKYFESCGIPVFSDITENFFDNSEIVLCLCLLNTIDNSLRDIYVTGAMRSEIFMFTDDDLLAIRRLNPEITDSEKNMWQSVKDIAESDIDDRELWEKCDFFVSTINRFKKYSVGTASDKLILRLYSELHLINVVSEKSFNRYTENAAVRRENLMIFYNLARNFEKTSFRGLSAFLEFLNDRMADPSDIRSAAAVNGDDAVKIMSIHHSKGLEFPVCFLCGLSGKFNKSDEQNLCIASDSMGIAFKLTDLSSMKSADSATASVKYDTPFRGAVRAFESEQLLEEQKRLLYVAMTRAKDRLILMLKRPQPDELVTYFEKSFDENGSYVGHAAGFFDWLYPCIAKYDTMRDFYGNNDYICEKLINDKTHCFDVETITVKNNFSVFTELKTENCVDKSEKEATEYKIRQRLSFHYPYAKLAEIRSKVSVSDIKNGKLSIGESVGVPEPDELMCPAFLNSGGNDSAERGTAMHEFMQFADYSECEKSVEDEAKRLLETGYISGEHYALLDYKRLRNFFQSDVYLEIKNSKRIMREYPFTLNLPLDELYENVGDESRGETMLVQGKVDCFFEDSNGRYTVVDFKTDKVSSTEELCRRYSLQLYYYRRAVCEMTETDNVRTVIYSFYKNEYAECKSGQNY